MKKQYSKFVIKLSQKSAIVTRAPFWKIFNIFLKLIGWYKYYINKLYV